MKALFLVLHRKDRSPGQRYRHEQYLDYFQSQGVQCVIEPLLETKVEDQTFYGQDQSAKILIGLKALVRRLIRITRLSKFEVIYIYRDAFFFGTFIEHMLKWSGRRIIFDFDDAIWLMDKNPNQGIFNKLKNPNKTAKIIRLSDQVITGNTYLYTYARKYNPNVTIIPSTIDLKKYQVPAKKQKEAVCIGWTGSFSTIRYFETVLPVLEQIKARYGDKVYFKLIGEPSYRHDALGIQGVPWLSETEAEDLSELDVGIMPLPDTPWTRGKCAMKGLQYMALGIATVLSPVGMNKDVIAEGENGFLAETESEWVDKLSQLIEDEALRKRLGEAGRQTVVKYYSVEANKEKWLAVFG